MIWGGNAGNNHMTYSLSKKKVIQTDFLEKVILNLVLAWWVGTRHVRGDRVFSAAHSLKCGWKRFTFRTWLTVNILIWLHNSQTLFSFPSSIFSRGLAPLGCCSCSNGPNHSPLLVSMLFAMCFNSSLSRSKVYFLPLKSGLALSLALTDRVRWK